MVGIWQRINVDDFDVDVETGAGNLYIDLIREGMLPGGCSPGKRCHTFWNRNIVLLPVVLGKVTCVPNNTLCELYGVKFWE